MSCNKPGGRTILVCKRSQGTTTEAQREYSKKYSFRGSTTVIQHLQKLRISKEQKQPYYSVVEKRLGAVSNDTMSAYLFLWSSVLQHLLI